MAESPNLGYLFYYKYFRNERLGPIDWKDLEKKSKGSENDKKDVTQVFQAKNRELTRHALRQFHSPVLPWLSEKPEDGQVFYLTTTGQGLLVGSGYTHETRLLNEFKLGFYFDHSSGLPIIPGSSVKGALRSPFILAPGFVIEIWDNMRRDALEKAPQEHLDETLKAWPRLDAAGLEEVEMEIFGARPRQQGTEENGRKGRDIFYEAVPVSVSGSSEGLLLGNDYITPHINRKNRALDAVTDPTPLQFLKVLPGVCFRFQFELTDGILRKGQKLELFRQIISQLGVGAKTNTNYGHFTD